MTHVRVYTDAYAKNAHFHRIRDALLAAGYDALVNISGLYREYYARAHVRIDTDAPADFVSSLFDGKLPRAVTVR